MGPIKKDCQDEKIPEDEFLGNSGTHDYKEEQDRNREPTNKPWVNFRVDDGFERGRAHGIHGSLLTPASLQRKPAPVTSLPVVWLFGVRSLQRRQSGETVR